MTERRIVRVAEIGVAGERSTLLTLGVGSCVAIILHDPVARVGGLAHPLLPADPSGGARPAPPERFGATAVGRLVERMLAAGARRERLTARLAGGACMFDMPSAEPARTLGERNVAAARAALREAGIPVSGEDVGGRHGRSISLRVADGRVTVSSVLHADVVL